MAIIPELNIQIPEIGQAVQVRTRLATVRAVDAYDNPHSGRVHLVDVEYLDNCHYSNNLKQAAREAGKESR